MEERLAALEVKVQEIAAELQARKDGSPEPPAVSKRPLATDPEAKPESKKEPKVKGKEQKKTPKMVRCPKCNLHEFMYKSAAFHDHAGVCNGPNAAEISSGAAFVRKGTEHLAKGAQFHLYHKPDGEDGNNGQRETHTSGSGRAIIFVVQTAGVDSKNTGMTYARLDECLEVRCPSRPPMHKTPTNVHSHTKIAPCPTPTSLIAGHWLLRIEKEDDGQGQANPARRIWSGHP